MDGQPIQDSERDQVIANLRQHFASGRLDRPTLDARVETALVTDDRGRLDELLADLPDLDSYTWQPTPNQRLEVYQAPPSPDQWQQAPQFHQDPMGHAGHPEPNRPNWWRRLGDNRTTIIAAAVGLLMLILFTRSEYATWMLWIFFVPLVGSALRSSGHSRRRGHLIQRPNQSSWSPAQPPPEYRQGPVDDRFDSDGDQRYR